MSTLNCSSTDRRPVGGAVHRYVGDAARRRAQCRHRQVQIQTHLHDAYQKDLRRRRYVTQWHC